MSDHLPECWLTEQPAWILKPFCICDRLRACEQRVREDERGKQRTIQTYEFGYRKGVQAARDAVAALSDERGVYVLREEALDAIDGLRGES